jgi:hypothetical protein
VIKMKECKFDNKLLEKIEARQRITRAWFFKGIIMAIWLFFTKLLIDAFFLIAKYLYSTVDTVWWHESYTVPDNSATLILIALCAIVLITYTYVLGKLWSYVNIIYDIESFW